MELYTFPRQLVGLVAYYSTYQYPYNQMPIGLPQIMEKMFTAIIAAAVVPDSRHPIDKFGFITFKSEPELLEYLEGILDGIPEFIELNLSRAERARGFTCWDVINDRSRREFRASIPNEIYYSEDGANQQYDFVSLGAVIRNVANTLVLDRQRLDKIAVSLLDHPKNPNSENHPDNPIP